MSTTMEVLEAAAMFFLPTPRGMDCAYPWGFMVHTPGDFLFIPLGVYGSYPWGFLVHTPGDFSFIPLGVCGVAYPDSRNLPRARG